MISFLSGASAALTLVVSLFFLRFWRRSHDRFFLFFSAAFLLFAVSRIAIDQVRSDEHSAIVYVPRLIGFLLIIASIIDKNIGASRRE